MESFLTLIWPSNIRVGCGNTLCNIAINGQHLDFRLVSCQYNNHVNKETPPGSLTTLYTWKAEPPTTNKQLCIRSGMNISDESLQNQTTESPEWTEWGICGQGVAITNRTKICIGRECKTDLVIETMPCPGLTQWGDWGTCVSTDGGTEGTQSRSRLCTSSSCINETHMEEQQVPF